jgi:hypothetical protein
VSNQGVHRALSGLFGGFLAAVLAYAGIKFADQSTPALIAAGLALCAASPLIFLLRPPQPVVKQHPVLVSSLCGLGCAMIMVGVQRYGEQHQPVLIIALLVLVGWMGYQQKVWRAGAARASDESNRTD